MKGKPTRIMAGSATSATSSADTSAGTSGNRPAGTVPTEVTEAWEAVRISFGYAAPYNLRKGREVIGGFRNAVR
jgi:hypothetical protein